MQEENGKVHMATSGDILRKYRCYNASCFGMLVQSVRMPACHAGGHGFKSRTYRQA